MHEKIYEVMELVREYGNQRAYDGHANEEAGWDTEALEKRRTIESKLRELLQPTGSEQK